MKEEQKKHPFKVPEGYFDDLKVSIKEQVKSINGREEAQLMVDELPDEKQPKYKVVNFSQSTMKIAASISVIIVLAGALLLWNSGFQPNADLALEEREQVLDAEVSALYSEESNFLFNESSEIETENLYDPILSEKIKKELEEYAQMTATMEEQNIIDYETFSFYDI